MGSAYKIPTSMGLRQRAPASSLALLGRHQHVFWVKKTRVSVRQEDITRVLGQKDTFRHLPII